MIPQHTAAEILRLFHAEHWRITTIATQLGLHHSTVRRVLDREGATADQLAMRPTMADPYLPFIQETLQKYPRLTATRLFEMVRLRGYPGGVDHFRDVVRRYRPRPADEAYLRLRTLPGEQAQVDWAHFGKIQIGNATRRLLAFVMVLSWSRQLFVRFYLGDAMPNFLRAHVAAFEFFGGVPRELLYDNLKSAVLERVGDAIRFHPTLLELASHYRYAPKPVAVARGNEKGRVERAIRFLRHSFFAARTFKDLDDLNAQALEWCTNNAAARRCPGERTMTVAEAFREEGPRLLLLPDNPFPTWERVEVRVGKTPYARFDLNDYSVPYTRVRRTLTVLADLDVVRILDGPEVVATHPRSFDRDQQIEDPRHVQELVAFKHEARKMRGMDRLHHAVPSTRDLLVAIAERGGNLGGTVSKLLKLLDLYGPAPLEEAIRESLTAGVQHLSGIQQVLERRLREAGLPPPIEVPLPDDPRVRNLVVVPHSLDAYDALGNGGAA